MTIYREVAKDSTPVETLKLGSLAKPAVPYTTPPVHEAMI